MRNAQNETIPPRERHSGDRDLFTLGRPEGRGSLDTFGRRFRKMEKALGPPAA